MPGQSTRRLISGVIWSLDWWARANSPPFPPINSLVIDYLLNFIIYILMNRNHGSN
jgi:hypothetical protein